MAGSTSQSCVGRSLKGALSGEAMAEWRPSEQVEKGITSTSVPYWDPDQDCGPEPSDMYERYTWNIEKFSQINKRELRSNAFEAGNYKWYILIYPQGCDVCNHLSLFLCVADHDKLLPGWSHLAQFTITVVNKDPNKSKFSDTLHRFWKKEHDWGWKKFIELSKVLDGFVNDDRLTIIAQVQVIRHRPDRLFRCLHSDYRTELLRVYLTNVEQTCRSFAEERRNKLVILREDKVRWSSFCAFWIAIDQSDRRHMCKEKRDAILKAMVKQFFIDKEVTSTLVMDSLYSGLRALEDQSKRRCKDLPKAEELRFPIVHVEKDMFVLVEDVLVLLERAYREPLPPPKDYKGPQNRLKDGCLEDSSKSSTTRDDMRLTELGCRTIEIFVLAHIFSKIEVAYQETIAFQRQEELIREEAVWLAESEQKAKRGLSEKEKKLKKKQAKQKRNNRKGKDKEKTDKTSAAVEDDLQHTSSSDNKEVMTATAELVLDKINRREDISDVSNSVSCLPEVPSPSSEKRDASWDNDGVETHPVTDAKSYSVDGHSVLQRETREMNNPIVDDSSSTCSTDSVQSVVRNDLHSGYSLPKSRNRKSLSRVKIDGVAYINEGCNRQSESVSRASKLIGSGGSGKSELQSKVVVLSLNSRKKDEHRTPDKEKTLSLQRNSSIKDQVIEEKHPKEKAKIIHQSLSTPSKILSSTVRLKPETKISDPTNPVVHNKPSSELRPQAERATLVINTADSTSAAKLEVLKVVPGKTSKSSAHPLPVVSRPPSAPVVPGCKPSTSINSHVQTSPVLSRSVSAAGRLGPDTSPSYLPLSYKNAIMGITHSHTPVSSLHPSQSHTQTSNSPNSTSDPSQLHTQLSPSPSSSFNPSQSHTQMSNSPGYSCDPLHLQTKMSPSPSSSFNPPQTHTQVSHSPSFLFSPSQVNTQLSHSTSSSLCPSQTHTQVSNPLSSSFIPSQLHTQSPHSPSSFSDPSHLCTQMSNLISASLSSPLSPDSIEPVSSNPSTSWAVANENPSRSQERPSHGGLGDDFPHLDIINNLLDEEEFFMESLHSLSSVATQLPHHFNFPVDISGLSPELVAASTSSCRFDQDYYDDGYQLSYGSLAGHCDSLDLGDMMPQISQGLYVNEPIDGLILSQWQMNGADLPYYSRTNADVDSNSYNFLDYANLACRVMGNTAFGPSNAH